MTAMTYFRPSRLAQMGKQDSSWRRVSKGVPSVVQCLVLVLVFDLCVGSKQMSETLQRALSAVRGPSPGAKKLLNIPEDGADPFPAKHVPPGGYESELEKEHALPTSVPNAEILKTNSNPTYHKPRPPQHLHGAAFLAGVGNGAVPSFAPPGRVFFTPPLPPQYKNPFADKPTLRGTSSDSTNYHNRRPFPPPSLNLPQDRIPIRPPGQGKDSPQVPAPPPAPPPGYEPQKKKPLNTPSLKGEGDGDLKRGTGQANFTDFVPNSLNIPTISRILSGSNGRKEEIPDVLLRTVTMKPQQNRGKTSKTGNYGNKDEANKDMSTEGVLAVIDPDLSNIDRPIIVDSNGELNTKINPKYSTNMQVDVTERKKDENYTPATTIGFNLRDPEMSTEKYHNLANVNSDKKILKQDTKNNASVQRSGTTWPFAWNIHIYLSTIMFTILAIYSIFKIICYNKFTHLFGQYYFIILHLILVSVCLLRIFYLCYDPYNINNSLPMFLSDILLHLPDIFLSIAFASTILFLIVKSFTNNVTCCSFMFRSRTIIIGGSLHVLSCIILHIVENINAVNKSSQAIEKRVLNLTCQIIFVTVCLILGLCYLCAYKKLKSILQKKNHTYIHGFQNLYQAIHINLATALLFVLMATLQIYGIVGINQISMTKFNWLQWGYQFSLRLIEVSIIALISWVISLRVSIVASLQHEKDDGHKISGLGLFPCGAGASNDQFESDYPAICNTNTNLHTYTLRTGKPIYESSGRRPKLSDECCGGPAIDHQRFQLNTLASVCDNNSGTENYSGHSSIANAGHSSSTESSNAPSSQGVTKHLIKHRQNVAGYNGIESASDDHYSNCDPAIQSLQGDDPLDHEYNVIQYESNSDFIRDIKNQNYNGGSNRSSHNFKHMSYDRVSSRTNSNQRKKHRNKNKNVQNMTMTYEPGHHYHQPHLPDEYGNYKTENMPYHGPGMQTFNSNRSYAESPCQVRTSQRRKSPSSSIVNSSGSQKRGKGNGFPDRPKSTDLYGFSEDPNDRNYPCTLGGTPQPAPRNCSYEASYSQPQDEIPNESDGNSMLVAQNGFVRFRNLEDGPPQA